MATIDVIMPQMGESIAEGTLSRNMSRSPSPDHSARQSYRGEIRQYASPAGSVSDTDTR